MFLFQLLWVTFLLFDSQRPVATEKFRTFVPFKCGIFQFLHRRFLHFSLLNCIQWNEKLYITLLYNIVYVVSAAPDLRSSSTSPLPFVSFGRPSLRPGSESPADFSVLHSFIHCVSVLSKFKTQKFFASLTPYATDSKHHFLSFQNFLFLFNIDLIVAKRKNTHKIPPHLLVAQGIKPRIYYYI